MKVLYRNAIFMICIYGSFCLKYDYRELQLECVIACDASNQICQQPPNICGECLPNYLRDFDGSCKPQKAIDLEKEEEEFNTAREEPSDLNVAVVKKEENGINFEVNQSSSVQQTPTNSSWTNDILLIALIACLSAAAIFGITIAIICWCKMRKSAKETSEYDYPGYGSMDYKGAAVGTKSAGDRKLVQSAQMYHYQHQKQQMLEMEKNQNAIAKSGSESSTDEENEGDEYTVYECPGLATSGDLEVPNPLFSEPAANVVHPEPPEFSTENRDLNLINGFKEP